MPSTAWRDPEPGSPRFRPDAFRREFAAKLRGTPAIYPISTDTQNALTRANAGTAAPPGPSRSHF